MPYIRQPEETDSGPSAVLRHRDDAERRRDRRAGREPRRPAHQDRRQPGASRLAGRLRPVSRRLRCCSSTIRTARSALTFQGEIRSWGGFYGDLRGMLAEQQSEKRRGHSHPHRDRHFAQHGRPAEYHQEALSAVEVASVGAGGGAQRARGRDDWRSGDRSTRITISSNANVVVSLDSDFLASGPGWPALRPRVFRQAARGGDQNDMNRLYVVGADADADGREGGSSLPDAGSRGGRVRLRAGRRAGRSGRRPSRQNRDIYTLGAAVARDLQTNKGASLVIAGEHQPPAVHALAHVHERGARQRRQDGLLHRSDRGESRGPARVAAGTGDGSRCGRGGTAADSRRQSGLQRAGGIGHVATASRRRRLRMHLSLYEDETSEVCQWHLPEAHYLETWGDARAYDGTVTIQQPLIEPLYGGRSANRNSADVHRYSAATAAWKSSRATGPRSTRARISSSGGAARSTMA